MAEITDYLGKEIEIIIDRPLGSRHPVHGFLYPVNYGFVPDTVGLDGEPIDAYVLGVSGPVDQFSGICIAIINRLDDNDDKLIVTKDGKPFDDDQIMKITNFQERFFQSIILRK